MKARHKLGAIELSEMEQAVSQSVSQQEGFFLMALVRSLDPRGEVTKRLVRRTNIYWIRRSGGMDIILTHTWRRFIDRGRRIYFDSGVCTTSGLTRQFTDPDVYLVGSCWSLFGQRGIRALLR